MECYREYLEVADDYSGTTYPAEIRMCHDFPPMAPTNANTVVIFDERVLTVMSSGWMGTGRHAHRLLAGVGAGVTLVFPDRAGPARTEFPTCAPLVFHRVSPACD